MGASIAANHLQTHAYSKPYFKKTSAISGRAAYSMLKDMCSSSSASLEPILGGGSTRFSEGVSEGFSDSELLVASWLDKLLKHFGLSELDDCSERELATMLESYADSSKGNSSAFENRALLLSLKQKIVRTAGARLDSTFVTMSPEVIDEEDAEAVSIEVENRKLQGLRYEGVIYRLTDTFLPCHRLQAFCLGQTLCEQKTAFIITQSPERFAVWVDVKAFPNRRRIPSARDLSVLGR